MTPKAIEDQFDCTQTLQIHFTLNSIFGEFVAHIFPDDRSIYSFNTAYYAINLSQFNVFFESA